MLEAFTLAKRIPRPCIPSQRASDTILILIWNASPLERVWTAITTYAVLRIQSALMASLPKLKFELATNDDLVGDVSEK